MQHWAAVIDESQFTTERLYAHESVAVPSSREPASGDPVLLMVAGPPAQLFGLGRIVSWYGTTVAVAYTHRQLDAPLPTDLDAAPGLTQISAPDYDRWAAHFPSALRTDADRHEWFVSVALPIEAGTRAEAVREFWSYVDKLGPRELPAFVWPRGDELAMQAYVLGTESNQDPEGDD
jgi:hypothetical protein